MRLKFHTFFRNFSRTRHGIHLITTAIRQNWSFPTNELMQTTCSFKHLCSGSQKQMIGVTKNDLGLHIIAQFLLMHTFNGATCTHWHKNRSLYRSMICVKNTCSCICILIVTQQLEVHKYVENYIWQRYVYLTSQINFVEKKL